MKQDECGVELGIWLPGDKGERNKAAFKQLHQQANAIEADFGGAMEWQEMPEGVGSRIRVGVDGGYRTPEHKWPDIYAHLVAAMIKLDAVLRKRVADLQL